MSGAQKVGVAALTIVAVVVLTVVGFAMKWGQTAVDVVSPANVKAQHSAVISGWESLQASARNACSVGSVQTDENSPTFVENPVVAYEATYRSAVVDYNQRMENVFKAGIVAPAGYPDRVPNLDIGPDTDWCSVADQLAAIVEAR